MAGMEVTLHDRLVRPLGGLVRRGGDCPPCVGDKAVEVVYGLQGKVVEVHAGPPEEDGAGAVERLDVVRHGAEALPDNPRNAAFTAEPDKRGVERERHGRASGKSGSSVATRRRAASAQCGARSMPTKRRPSTCATSSVTPDPAKQSSTTSPGRELVRTM